jgi:hypothetical protein
VSSGPCSSRQEQRAEVRRAQVTGNIGERTCEMIVN